MSDLDLAAIRERIEHDQLFGAREVARMADRIESLEAERDKAQRGGRTLGKIVEDQCRAALDATGLHHLIDETGDGDWGAVWENLAELGERADRAEARLARVTEDRVAERIRDELAQVTIQNGCGHETSIATDEAAEMAEWVLTAIRAVAADEQEADRG